MKPASPQTQLTAFLAKFSPDIQKLAKSALKTLRARLPGAVQMVYDNFNALVIGFSANERASEAVFSVVVFPKKVALCFIWGAKLKDPTRRLRGSGNQVRNILLDGPQTFAEPAVKTLMEQAIAASAHPFAKGRGKMEIRAIHPRARPRRPQEKRAKR